jgi:putative peptidoglycan lipid II flippase
MKSIPNRFKKLLKIQGQETILEAVIKSSFINLAARGFGYLKQVTIAVLLGFNLQTDAFFMALSLIGLFLIFADVFDSIGVPNLVRARLRSEEEFKNLAGLLFTFTLILTFLVTLSAIFLYPLVLKIPVGFNKEALEYTIS